jgi:hypothetical protein
MSLLKRIALISSLLAVVCASCLGIIRISSGKNPLPIVLRALPFPSSILGPPKGIIFAKELPQENYLSVLPASTKTCPPFPLYESVENISLAFPEVFVLTLKNARVYGFNGVVITSEDKVLADTAMSWGPGGIKNHKVFRKRKLPKMTYSDETIAVVASKSSD